MDLYEPAFLQVASVVGPVELVKMLVEHKADVNFPVSSIIRYFQRPLLKCTIKYLLRVWYFLSCSPDVVASIIV